MKIIFEKFYKRVVDDGTEERFAVSANGQKGEAVRFTKDGFSTVTLLDFSKLTELTRDEWIKLGEPISLDLHWAGDPPEVLPKRELTAEEAVLDQEYRAKVYGVHALRMKQIREALADSTHDLVEITTTVSTKTTCNSVPLAAALGHLLAPDPDPVDPIAWRRRAGVLDAATKMGLVSGLIEALGPLVESFAGGRIKASVKPSAGPSEAPAAAASAPAKPGAAKP